MENFASVHLKLSGILLLLAPTINAYADVNLTSQHETSVLAPTAIINSSGDNVFATLTTPIATLVLPSNPQITAGSAQIAQSGNTLTITENSPTAVINWDSFNISQNGTVDFHQPNAQAIVLNRVENGSIEIDGKLTANGQVFLLDANGVVFGSTAQVNVGALVASSLSLSDSNFLNGNYQFQLSQSNRADVVNNGRITAADGGYIALLSNQNAINNGNIQARLGVVELAAGDSETLVLDQGQLVSIQVDPATVNTLVANNQLIQAYGGRVILSTSAASTLNSAVVSNSGIIEANTLSNLNGQIALLATGDASQVNNSGTLDVSAPNGGNAGTITEQAGTVIDNGKPNDSGETNNVAGNLITVNGNDGNASIVTGGNGNLIIVNGNNGNAGIVTSGNLITVNSNNGNTSIVSGGSGSIDLNANNSITISTVVKGNGGSTINKQLPVSNTLISDNVASVNFNGSDNLSVNAGVITTTVDKSNLTASNRLSNPNNEASENQSADISILGNGINDGLPISQ